MVLSAEFWLAVAIALLGYAVGGIMHIAIDYVHGKKLLRTYWAATDTKIAAIEDQVIAKLPKPPELPAFPAFPEIPPPPDLEAFKAQLLAEIPQPAVAAELEAFLRSEAGVTWARELAALAAANFEQAFLKKATDNKGIQARRQQSTTASILLNNIDFGDKRMNAIWAILDDDVKQVAVQRIAKAINRAGFLLIPMNEVPAGAAEQLAQGGDAPSGEPPAWGSI